MQENSACQALEHNKPIHSPGRPSPSVFSEIVPAASRVPKRKQATLVEVVEKAKKYDPKSARAQELNHAVTHYIVKDMQPFYCVERSGFKHLVNVLDPKYQIPSRKHFSKYEIPKLYNEVIGIVKPEVQRARYFAASTDLWSSKANHPYLSFTVHFISKSWDLNSYCLDTVPIFEDHTGQNLADAIQDILANWELKPEDLVGTTTDNGSNFIAAFNLLDWPRISCFGHNLDLAINKVLKIHRID